MSKLISYTALRKQFGEAMRPIRLALHSTESGKHAAVEFLGYRFTGIRCPKARGQTGFVWRAEYVGVPITEQTRARWPLSTFGGIGGGLDEAATQLHSRLRTECAESALPA